MKKGSEGRQIALNTKTNKRMAPSRERVSRPLERKRNENKHKRNVQMAMDCANSTNA